MSALLDAQQPQKAARSVPPSQWWKLLKSAALDWDEDNASRLAAALAYYTLLSMAPLLVLAVATTGLFFGEDAARGQIAGQLSASIGPTAAEALQDVLAHARAPEAGIVSGAIGFVTLFFGASGVFAELQGALNQIWEVAPKPDRGWRGIVRDRFFSFAMVVGVGFLLLASMLLTAVLSALGTLLEESLPGGEPVWQLGNLVFSLALVAGLFALIFKVVPDAKVRWRDVWFGATATAFLFTVGKLALGLYLGGAAVVSAYGAAGSLVALVVWTYYSTQILFFGAELTQAHARMRGAAIEPTANAIFAAAGVVHRRPRTHPPTAEPGRS
jgi:membrane protein